MSDSEPDKNITATVSGIKDNAMTVEMKGKKMRVVKNANGCWNVNTEGEVPDAAKAPGDAAAEAEAETAVTAAEEAGDEEKGVLIDTAQFAIDKLPEESEPRATLQARLDEAKPGKGGARRKRRSNKRKPKKSAKKPKRSKKGKTRKQKK